MSVKAQPVTVSILNKEYRIMCTPEEHDILVSSATKLDAQMREIQAAGKITERERIAVMVALNVMDELQQLRKKTQAPEHEFASKLANLTLKIENVLESP